MRRRITRLALLLASLPFATLACDKGGDAATTAPVAEANTTTSTAPTAAVVTAAPTTEAAPAMTAVAPAAAETKAPAGADAPADKAAAAPATTDAAQPGEKTFECGGKGQKLCPMQAWMKGTMAVVSSSGDGEKIAQALQYVAGKPPPGMATWSAIAKSGATKAKAGDVDGSKASCKQCHDLYKDKYKKTVRDRAW